MAIFGYNTQGASAMFDASPFGCQFTPGQSGVVTDVFVYCVFLGSNYDVRTAIYADSSGLPGAKLAESSAAVTVSASGWIDTSVSLSIVAGTPYHLAVWSSNNQCEFVYDAGSANQTNEVTGQTYPTWPNPFGTPTFQFARQISIYATFTPTADALEWIRPAADRAAIPQHYRPTIVPVP